MLPGGLSKERQTMRCRNRYTPEGFDPEEHARKLVNRANPDMEYVDGYVTVDKGKVRIRCKVCGQTFERAMCTIRKGRKTKCPFCAENQKEEKIKEHLSEVKAAREQRHASTVARNEAKKEAKKHPCRICGKKTTRHAYCSTECAQEANKLRARSYSATHEATRRVRMRSQISDRGITLVKLYQRDAGVCWICGMECLWSDKEVTQKAIVCGNLYPSVDHVVPLSKGGAHAWSNVKLAHRICNSKRFYSSPGVNPF